MVLDNPDLKELVRSEGRILVRLRRALYGLKTAGCSWFEEVRGKLLLLVIHKARLILAYSSAKTFK